MTADETTVSYPRYRVIKYRDGKRIWLKDDGYRIFFRLVGAKNIDPKEWIHWAEYKHCDLPGPAFQIASELMSPGASAGIPSKLMGFDSVDELVAEYIALMDWLLRNRAQ